MTYARIRDANEREVVEALEGAGWTVTRLHSDSKAGIPDLLCYRGGVLRLVEVKMPKEKPTAHQEAFMAKHRGTVIVARSGLEAVRMLELTR